MNHTLDGQGVLPAADAGPIAILVIHGIGSQAPGEFLASWIRRLHEAYPGGILTSRTGNRIQAEDVRRLGLHEVVLTHGARELRFYEVYWADRLAGDPVAGSFHKFLFEETTWFPWLNWKAGLLPVGQYTALSVTLGTTALWLGSVGVTLLLELAELAPKGARARILDQIVADVWNYSHSFREVLPAQSPLSHAGREIVDRVAERARQARTDGCQEVQILAHSLGTVVAYHALSTPVPADSPEDPLPLTRLITIGSPLEKFLFIWTALLRHTQPVPEIRSGHQVLARGAAMEWINAYSPIDLVSGRLRRFDHWGAVRNIRLWGLGGLAGAHTAYAVHPQVLTLLAQGLGIAAQAVRPPWIQRWRHLLRGATETLMVPVILAASVAVSGLMFLLLGAVLGLINGLVLYGVIGWWASPLLRGIGISITFGHFLYCMMWIHAAATLPLLMLFMTTDGRRRASVLHQRHWR